MLAIKAKNLGKKYELYSRPADVLKEVFSGGKKHYHEDFWALKDISVEIPMGSALGIIGENGAGKSTLLKLLTGSLNPTEGELAVNGRLSAILELGAGFHPEFTGRDNIYMNCSILGMSREEIDEKFQGIVDFSELGDFIERPLKTYSSGMYVRLAFSVATSIDPYILIVDEALSVGDQHFQKKCIDRIMGYREAGKTIIFCSHNMYQIKRICDSALWLKEGRVAAYGKESEVTDKYVDYERQKDAAVKVTVVDDANFNGEERQSNMDHPGRPLVKEVILTDENGNTKNIFKMGEVLEVNISYETFEADEAVVVGVVMLRNDKVRCYGVSTQIDGINIKEAEPGIYCIRLKYPDLPLLSGEYFLNVILLDESGVHIYDRVQEACQFKVKHDSVEMGIVYLEHEWVKVKDS